MINLVLTALGVKLRNVRLRNDELLFDMSKKLDCEPYFLSRVETGKRRMPEEWIVRLGTFYCLSAEEIEEIKTLAYGKKLWCDLWDKEVREFDNCEVSPRCFACVEREKENEDK